MKKLVLFISFFIFIVSFSQNTQKTILESFIKKTGSEVSLNRQLETPNFIKFPNALSISGHTIEEKVISFLNEHKNIFNIKEIAEFDFKEIEIDNYGFFSIKLKQKHKTVPVYDGELRFHFNKKMKLTAINGNYIPNIQLNTTYNISAIQANTIAIEKVSKSKLVKNLKVKNNKTYIFHKGLVQNQSGANYLVYEIEVSNDNNVREFVFVNAKNGKIVEQFTGIAHAMDRVLYEGNTSNIIWQEGDAFPGSLSNWQQNEITVSAHVYNFFKNAFDYISYDNLDAQMRTINNNPSISCPNANWNGSTVNYCDGTASDDVIAHEWGHAYTQYTSGLVYAYQSGAINESFSDIWGETIDLINLYEDGGENLSIRSGCSDSQRWMMGEDATAFGGAIRDMWNPNCLGLPGMVSDELYFDCSSGDNGGVHTNSSIPNHLYALLVDGGNFNGKIIASLGLTKTAHIFWRAQKEYLTATSDFQNLADAIETSCSDLIGVDLIGLSTEENIGSSGYSITSADVTNVINGILAVELRSNLNFCNYATVLSRIDDLCTAYTDNPIFFENWESGIGDWTLEQLPENSSTWESRDWAIETNLPGDREGNAIFGVDAIIGDCQTDFENGIIRLESPEISIPNYTDGNFEMAFTHYVAMENLWDGGVLEFRIDGGEWTYILASAFTENGYNGTLEADNDNPLFGKRAFTGTDEGTSMGSWGTSVINLSSIGVIPNSTVQFRWDLGTDGCNGRLGWYIDDISIYNCSSPLALSEFDLDNLIQVYPNPSKGLYTLKTTNDLGLLHIKVYDISGRLIKTIQTEEQKSTIDLSSTSSGLYYLKVFTENSNATIKLIKI